MKEDSVFEPRYVLTNANVSTKGECLALIAKKAEEFGICNNAQATIDGFLEREEVESTGFSDGFAIPHTRCDAILKPAVMVVKTKSGIDWPSMDGQPTVVILALLVPKQVASTTHLTLLASLSRKLVNADFQKSLLCSCDPDEIFGIINQAIQS
nr:PTS sugar transporter subunit IIA [uncultured Caproiciproducens sp.]